MLCQFSLGMTVKSFKPSTPSPKAKLLSIMITTDEVDGSYSLCIVKDTARHTMCLQRSFVTYSYDVSLKEE